MAMPRSDAWQPQNRAQASERTFVELQRTAVNRSEFDDDRQAEAGAGARLVEPFAALYRGGARAPIEAGPVVVDLGDEKAASLLVLRRGGRARSVDGDPLARPFSGVVEQVANEVG